ncbi:PPE domain-containing protein [Nocardia transvalensis]|uniref:PPE domain-containing protein n=1 Tax=Nocardia transvalensis TaxID=37333 RepID=UPI001894DA1B|nr:PPE domain-containing protein [Nocardia transvalensis]MBF6330539.1 PPE domain-containing protein [Nocardia transvalensis]
MGDNDSSPNWQFPSPGQLAGAIAAGDINLPPGMVPKSNAALAAQESAQSAAGLVRTGGHDPDYIPAGVMELFDSMKHEDIKANVDKMLPGVMHEAAKGWRKVSDAVMFNSAGLFGKVRKTMEGGGWVGESANAMMAATQRFTDEMADLHNVVQSVTSRIESVAYAAEVIKVRVPPVPEKLPNAASFLSVKAPDGSTETAYDKAKREAEQDAQWVMKNHYVPTYEPAGQKVPTFVPPAGPGGDSGGSTSWSPGGTSGGAGGPGGTSGGSDSADGKQNGGDQATDPAQVAPSSVSPDATTGQGGTAQTPGTSGATRPAGLDSAPTTTAGVTPGGTGGGGRSGGGVPGMGGGIGRPGAGGPGRSIPGGTIGNPAGGAAGLGRAAAGAGGMAGMPGMMNPGAKGKGEDDEKERKGNPDLLVHERNKLDLLGEPIRAVPQAIGADAVPEPDRRGTEGNR